MGRDTVSLIEPMVMNQAVLIVRLFYPLGRHLLQTNHVDSSQNS